MGQLTGACAGELLPVPGTGLAVVCHTSPASRPPASGPTGGCLPGGHRPRALHQRPQPAFFGCGHRPPRLCARQRQDGGGWWVWLGWGREGEGGVTGSQSFIPLHTLAKRWPAQSRPGHPPGLPATPPHPAQVLDSNGKVVPHLYCIGDANGKYMLAHAASAQGIAVVECISG